MLKPYQFNLHPIDDRTYWDNVRDNPKLEGIRARMQELLATVPDVPEIASGSDFLAGARDNDRGRTDGPWQIRYRLGVLASQRCIDGMGDDDRLVNHIWAQLTQACWTVAAHLPGQELPLLSRPHLDLASCGLALLMAESAEMLKPWMESVSKNLFQNVVDETRRRVIDPFADGHEEGWSTDETIHNNWTGVCAGSLLSATVSLINVCGEDEKLLAARKRALYLLNAFFEKAFTPAGECDEGVGYWSYGVGVACQGLMRLTPEQIAGEIDMDRFKLVADYPRRCHLFGNNFFAGNDAPWRTNATLDYVPWLAAITQSQWLTDWYSPETDEVVGRKQGGSPRSLDSVLRMDLAPGKLPTPPMAQWLTDQQVLITRSESRRLLATLTGGTNAENHNHNDIGAVTLAVDEKWAVPDLGNMQYVSDYFGPKRYTYLAASSRGHNVPVINGQEEPAGREIAGKVVTQSDKHLKLDLTAAFPPEAKLNSWIRELLLDGEQAVLHDTFELAEDGELEHVLWLVDEPKLNGNAATSGPLNIQLDVDAKWKVESIRAGDHRLREFDKDATLYRLYAPMRGKSISFTTTFRLV